MENIRIKKIDSLTANSFVIQGWTLSILSFLEDYDDVLKQDFRLYELKEKLDIDCENNTDGFHYYTIRIEFYPKNVAIESFICDDGEFKVDYSNELTDTKIFLNKITKLYNYLLILESEVF